LAPGVPTRHLLTEEEPSMAKSLSCKDMGQQCDFVARGDNEVEVLSKILDHAARAHGMKEIDMKTLEKMKAAIKNE
jgi:predicted small metal-binding protein